MAKRDPMHFFMPMQVPTATQQEKKLGVRNGRPYTYPSEKWERARDELKSRLESHRPQEPIAKGVPVVLTVTWCFPTKGHADGTPHVGKPDTDNLDKGLKDIMTELGWWADDAQVFSEHITKIHSRYEGVRIDIECVEGE